MRRTPRSLKGSSSEYVKGLRSDTMSELVKKAEYAVRGAIVIRSSEIEAELRAGTRKYPFDEIISCNIGNPQALQMKPITFPREVLGLWENPDLISRKETSKLFSKASIDRAASFLEYMHGGGTGAYSHSQGLQFVRDSVVKFIEKRDGFPSIAEDIWITDGASSAIKMVLQCIVRGPQDGIMLPIPQYPLYSATISMLDGTICPYYMDEEKGWAITAEELEHAYDEASKSCQVRALVSINPGNPTGQVFNRDTVQTIIEFCHKHNLVLLADEVYQENVYATDKQFHSFKKTYKEMGSEYDGLELFSFHSVSKGVLGECGKRGGYMEAVGIDPQVHEQLYKMSSVSLCSNINGQLMVELMCHPPPLDSDASETWLKETHAQYASLQRRAAKLEIALNSMPGVTCNPIEGAMYAFPQIRLPDKAIQAAKAKGIAADAFYCFDMLENTGVVVVPGSGFGQVDGTHHYRTTILPPEDQIDKVCERVAKFHTEFLKKFS